MEDIEPYVNKILSQIYPEKILDKDALKFIETFLNGFLIKLLNLYDNNISESLIHLLSGELLYYSLRESIKSINIYILNKNEDKYDINYTLARLTFNTNIIENALNKLHMAKYTDYFVIYLTSLIEYITSEIINQSANKNKQIKQKNLIERIQQDSELNLFAEKIFGENWFKSLELPQTINYKNGEIKNIDISRDNTIKPVNLDKQLYNKDDFSSKLNFFIDNCKAIIRKNSSLFENLEVKITPQYYKLYDKDKYFVIIDKNNGDIYKPTTTGAKSSNSKPEGNINDSNNGLTHITYKGVVTESMLNKLNENEKYPHNL